MPTFRFLDTETGEEFEDFLSNSRKEELLIKNPHVQQMPTLFGIASMAAAGEFVSKTDDTWREVLSKAAEAHPDSPLGERYGKKTIHQVKAREIYKKWKNK